MFIDCRESKIDEEFQLNVEFDFPDVDLDIKKFVKIGARLVEGGVVLVAEEATAAFEATGRLITSAVLTVDDLAGGAAAFGKENILKSSELIKGGILETSEFAEALGGSLTAGSAKAAAKFNEVILGPVGSGGDAVIGGVKSGITEASQFGKDLVADAEAAADEAFAVAEAAASLAAGVFTQCSPKEIFDGDCSQANNAIDLLSRSFNDVADAVGLALGDAFGDALGFYNKNVGGEDPKYGCPMIKKCNQACQTISIPRKCVFGQCVGGGSKTVCSPEVCLPGTAADPVCLEKKILSMLQFKDEKETSNRKQQEATERLNENRGSFTAEMISEEQLKNDFIKCDTSFDKGSPTRSDDAAITTTCR